MSTWKPSAQDIVLSSAAVSVAPSTIGLMNATPVQELASPLVSALSPAPSVAPSASFPPSVTSDCALRLSPQPVKRAEPATKAVRAAMSDAAVVRDVPIGANLRISSLQRAEMVLVLHGRVNCIGF